MQAAVAGSARMADNRMMKMSMAIWKEEVGQQEEGSSLCEDSCGYDERRRQIFYTGIP